MSLYSSTIASPLVDLQQDPQAGSKRKEIPLSSLAVSELAAKKIKSDDEFLQSTFTFSTDVTVLDPASKTMKKVAIAFAKFGDRTDTLFLDVYVKNEGTLGRIRLDTNKSAVYIVRMDTYDSKPSKNVGRAMHELAVRYSFFKGFDGQVEFFAENDSAGFHFKCGYRFDNKWHLSAQMYLRFGQQKVQGYRDLCERYRQTVAMNGDTEALVKEVMSHDLYKEIIKTARVELKRDPQDINEALEYGLYICWDANYFLDIYYNHSERNLKSIFCNPASKRFHINGNMQLSDEARDRWRQIVQNKK